MFSVELIEIAERVTFGFVSVKDRQEFCDREQVPKLLRQTEQLELSAFFVDCGVAGNQLADAARIDIAHAGQIQKNLLLAFFQQAPDGAAQGHAAFADGDAAIHV